MAYLSKNPTVCRKAGKITRCFGHQKIKTKKCADSTGGHGFLKYSFAPIIDDQHVLPHGANRLVNPFYTSLKNFCTLYNIEVPPTKKLPFPVNISTAYESAKDQLVRIATDLHVAILADKTRPCSLVTFSCYDTGRTLYYIPVRPLVDLLQEPQKEAMGNLLLSIFSYLHVVSGIPWFMDCGSYLSSVYECLQGWYIDSSDQEESEATEILLASFDQMEIKARRLKIMLDSEPHWKSLEAQTAAFKPTDPLSKLLHNLASNLVSLDSHYPARSILDSIPTNLLYPEIEERIDMDSYISFFWDSEDMLYDSLMDYVNTSFQECGTQEEPVAIQWFDQPQSEANHDLDFEMRFFNVLSQLCDFLNSL